MMPRASEGPEGRPLPGAMRTYQTTARLAQDPDDAQSQRGTGKTPAISDRFAQNPPQQELSKNPTVLWGLTGNSVT